jgi:hypothetical protein
MQNNFLIQILWVASGVATVIAAPLAGRSALARYVGRAAVALLFIVGGALLHVVNLAADADYADFADAAHFGWVTDAWQAVVPGNAVLLIGLLAVFEATVGALILSGGRGTQLGYAAVVAFYLALWPFGWIQAVWAAVMLAPMLLLLRAELRTAAPATPSQDNSRVEVSA